MNVGQLSGTISGYLAVARLTMRSGYPPACQALATGAITVTDLPMAEPRDLPLDFLLAGMGWDADERPTRGDTALLLDAVKLASTSDRNARWAGRSGDIGPRT